MEKTGKETCKKCDQCSRNSSQFFKKFDKKFPCLSFFNIRLIGFFT